MLATTITAACAVAADHRKTLKTQEDRGLHRNHLKTSQESLEGSNVDFATYISNVDFATWRLAQGSAPTGHSVFSFSHIYGHPPERIPVCPSRSVVCWPNAVWSAAETFIKPHWDYENP